MGISQNKIIRDKIVELLEAKQISGIELHAFKKVRLTGENAAVCVYLEQGEVDLLEVNAALTVRIMAADINNVDDLLDSIAVQVQEELMPGDNLSGVCSFLVYSGFEYDRDETEGWTALDLAYTVNY